MATISSHYFRVCIQGARRRGMDITPLLRTAGIDPKQIEDPLWRGSTSTMAHLVRLIWRELDDEFMGYTASPMRHGVFALMAELCLYSGSVLQAIEKGVQLYNLIQADIRTRVSLQEDQVQLDVYFAQPELDPDHYFVEFWLIIWHRLACWLANETLSLHEAQFNYPRPESYFEEFKYLFPCPHRFDRPHCQISLDLPQMRAPIRRTRSDLEEMIAHAPLELMTIPASDHSLARQVRLYLTQSGHFHPRLAETAAALGISSERMRRQLRREGATLGSIVQNVQRDRATRLLLESNRSVEEISAELGYAEPRSFTRAFRHWSGTSPTVYRRRFGRH